MYSFQIFQWLSNLSRIVWPNISKISKSPKIELLVHHLRFQEKMIFKTELDQNKNTQIHSFSFKLSLNSKATEIFDDLFLWGHWVENINVLNFHRNINHRPKMCMSGFYYPTVPPSIWRKVPDPKSFHFFSLDIFSETSVEIHETCIFRWILLFFINLPVHFLENTPVEIESS